MFLGGVRGADPIVPNPVPYTAGGTVTNGLKPALLLPLPTKSPISCAFALVLASTAAKSPNSSSGASTASVGGACPLATPFCARARSSRSVRTSARWCLSTPNAVHLASHTLSSRARLPNVLEHRAYDGRSGMATCVRMRMCRSTGKRPTS